MQINDNLTAQQQGTLQKIRNIGDPLMNKLHSVMKDILFYHTQAVGEIFKEITEGQHIGKSQPELERLFKEKVRKLSCSN